MRWAPALKVSLRIGKHATHEGNSLHLAAHRPSKESLMPDKIGHPPPAMTRRNILRTFGVALAGPPLLQLPACSSTDTTGTTGTGTTGGTAGTGGAAGTGGSETDAPNGGSA